VIKAVVTDIEGTTTSLAFVREVLFPYARQRLPAFVRARRAEPAVAALLAAAQQLAGRALDVDGLVQTLLQWSDADAKVTPLKALQGAIWADGYAAGELVGHVYDDAAANLRAWHAAGVRLFVFSSGSVSAQQLLFRHSRAGDLTPCFRGWFDTTTGGKGEPASYRRIAAAIGEAPQSTLFLSDTPAELDAARSAGLAAQHVDRDGRPTARGAVATFDPIDVLERRSAP
jgi:enolase-phosphatase E1